MSKVEIPFGASPSMINWLFHFKKKKSLFVVVPEKRLWEGDKEMLMAPGIVMINKLLALDLISEIKPNVFALSVLGEKIVSEKNSQ